MTQKAFAVVHHRWEALGFGWILHFVLATNAWALPPAPFTEEAASRGLAYSCTLQAGYGEFGVAFADLDGDGDPDVVLLGSGDGLVGVFENDGNGYFTDRSAGCGMTAMPRPSGVVAFDHDGDGDLDVYLAQGGLSYCVATADVDSDGDLDLLVQNYNDSIRLYINNEGQSRSSIKFKILGAWPNYHAIGSVVDIRTATVWQTREVIAGCNFKSQNDLVVHFGLNEATLVDEVFVRWPGGVTRTLGAVAAGAGVKVIYPPDLLGDLNLDGLVTYEDILGFLDALLAQTSDADTVARADIKGDWSVDGRDTQGFVSRMIP